MYCLRLILQCRTKRSWRPKHPDTRAWRWSRLQAQHQGLPPLGIYGGIRAGVLGAGAKPEPWESIRAGLTLPYHAMDVLIFFPMPWMVMDYLGPSMTIHAIWFHGFHGPSHLMAAAASVPDDDDDDDATEGTVPAGGISMTGSQHPLWRSDP